LLPVLLITNDDVHCISCLLLFTGRVLSTANVRSAGNLWCWWQRWSLAWCCKQIPISLLSYDAGRQRTPRTV